MKFATLVLLALCGGSMSAYLNDEYELARLRKFLTHEMQYRDDSGVCTAPVDIIFIMDRSRSIWAPNFELEKKFVQGVVKMFDSKESRFGVLTFAEGADVAIKFGGHGDDQKALIADIGRISQEPERGGSTETWAALQLLRTQFKSFHGMRKNAAPIAVLITDGASQEKEKTKQEAAEVHAMGIEVFAIGIKETGFDANELRAIASDPDQGHLYMLDNWQEAMDSLRDIASEVCPSNIEDCKHNRPLDLIFSLSNLATSTETGYAFDLIEGVLGKVTLGPGEVQVGLAPRSCIASWQAIALNAHDTSNAYIQALMSRESSFSNSLKTRFRYLTKVAFTAKNGAQMSSDAGKVAVVVVDRKDEISSVESMASGLRRDGVKLIVLAVGEVTAADVSKLTSSNDVIHVTSYRGMSGVLEQLLKLLCNAQKFQA